MFDDDEWGWIHRVEDILNNSFTGGFTYRSPDNYGEHEDGVLYASKTLEVLDFEDYLSISMELRNVSEDELDVHCEEEFISIKYMFEGMWRERPLRLPFKVNPDTAKISFNNFILDIELEKMKDDERIRKDMQSH